MTLRSVAGTSLGIGVRKLDRKSRECGGSGLDRVRKFAALGAVATALTLLFASCQPTTFDPPTDIGTPPADSKVTTRQIVSDLDRPVWVTAPPDDPSRIFVLEQHSGRIVIVDLSTEATLESPFVEVEGLATGNEEGLLGMAFAPDYEESGRFYLYYTASIEGGGSESRIARGTVSEDDPNLANPDLDVLLAFSQPFENHNGGWIGFGPDGYLYVASGDGGGGNDPADRAQDRNNLRGKILRLDVSTPTGFAIPEDNPFLDENPESIVFAYGLRNPWRCAFDKETGVFYVADVGESAREEINAVPLSEASGANFGWPCREGKLCLATRTGCDCADDDLVPPIYDYPHSTGLSVTGGVVYRGSALPELQGAYLFADYVAGVIFSLTYEDGEATALINWTEQMQPASGDAIGAISSFGEDGNGEVYLCDLRAGAVYRLEAKADVD